MRHRLLIALLTLILIVIILWLIGIQVRVDASISNQGLPFPTSTMIAARSVEGVINAIRLELGNRKDVFVYSAYITELERVSISSLNQDFASAWMILFDPNTGQVVPSEPGLALLVWEQAAWVVYLPGDPGWGTLLQTIPNDLVSADDKSFWQEINTTSEAAIPSAPLAGYYLPWEFGKTVFLSGSLAHDSYIPSGNAHYAFDFYLPGASSSQMFDLYAARAGTTWLFWDGQLDHSEDSPGNYLVLKDNTTDPTTYQLYLHLAQNSIPAELKKVGTLVAKGQYIGRADDTGQSTGNHLHFQVHTEPNSYWGRAVDITFNDVSINGGRPRIEKDKSYCNWPGDVCDSVQNGYVSGNIELIPTSVLNLLAPKQDKTAFLLSWESLEGASPISYFELQVNVDIEGWQDLNGKIPGNLSNYWFLAEPGHLYAFRMRAVDVDGRLEEFPENEETVTYVPSPAELCVSPDGFENNNNIAEAKPLLLDEKNQFHNFCNLASGNFADDLDWVRIPVLSGQQFTILALPDQDSPAEPWLTLYMNNGNGLSPILSATSVGYGNPAWVTYNPSSNEDMYLLIQPGDSRVFGEGAGYTLTHYAGPPYTIWLPTIKR